MRRRPFLSAFRDAIDYRVDRPLHGGGSTPGRHRVDNAMVPQERGQRGQIALDGSTMDGTTAYVSALRGAPYHLLSFQAQRRAKSHTLRLPCPASLPHVFPSKAESRAAEVRCKQGISSSTPVHETPSLECMAHAPTREVRQRCRQASIGSSGQSWRFQSLICEQLPPRSLRLHSE